MPYILKSIIYTWSAGIIVGYFIYLLTKCYFEENFIYNNRGWVAPFHLYLIIFIIIVIINTFYMKDFACLGIMFAIGFFGIWKNYFFNQYANGDKSLNYIDIRRNVYGLMSAERIKNEYLMSKVDNCLASVFWKTIAGLLKLVVAILAINIGVNYDFLTNPSIEMLNIIWRFYNKNLGLCNSIIFFCVFFVAFLGINYIELQTRRYILEDLINEESKTQK